MGRKVILLDHDGGELANQLWNYASVAAYAFEKGWQCENWSFYENAKYFAHTEASSFPLRFVFFNALKSDHGRKWSGVRPSLRKLYRVLVLLPMQLLYAKRFVRTTHSDGRMYLLPPSVPANKHLANLEQSMQTLYFASEFGCLFRNPEGMRKHRSALVERFAPTPSIAARVKEIIMPLRPKYKTIVGVHVRQGDYRTWKGGKYWIPQSRIREILDEYLRNTGQNADEVCFVFTSDGPIEDERFTGLHIVKSREDAGTDLFLLSRCDVVIGSHSTFGNFAAWLGDITHIIMQNEPMEWEYYKNRGSYFENRFFSLVV